MSLGCGCKICKAGLGEYVNELITDGNSPDYVIETLADEELNISKKLLKKHLYAFDIPYPYQELSEICTVNKVDLNQIDFSEYNFDDNQPESIIGYLQKINLKIYLNQLKITVQAQNDVLDGKAPDVPVDVFKNLVAAHAMLDKITGMGIRVNQAEAIKTVEAMGFTITDKSYLLAPNVEPQTNYQTD